MKDIKDYLHLYLPCPVELDNGGSKIYSRIAVACGNMDDRFRYVTLREGNGKNSFTHSVLFSENRVKPILRPLSDMTEEEARVILPDMPTENKLIEWGYYNEYSEGNVFYQYLKKAEDERLISILEDSLGVPEHWLFLLSKGFDLFGLIEAGLAIDLTKLNKEK